MFFVQNEKDKDKRKRYDNNIIKTKQLVIWCPESKQHLYFIK